MPNVPLPDDKKGRASGEVEKIVPLVMINLYFCKLGFRFLIYRKNDPTTIRRKTKAIIHTF